MMGFAPVPNVPGSVGAIVALESGQIGALYDGRQNVAAIYLADGVTMARAHSAATVDELRAAIGLLSDLVDLMQTPAAPGITE